MSQRGLALESLVSEASSARFPQPAGSDALRNISLQLTPKVRLWIVGGLFAGVHLRLRFGGATELGVMPKKLWLVRNSAARGEVDNGYFRIC